MGEQTGISWTDRTKSPWHGCSKVSAGCFNCYAAREAARFPARRGVWGNEGTRIVSANWGQYLAWDRQARSERKIISVFPSICDPFEDFRGKMTDKDGNLFESSMGDIRNLFFDEVIAKTPNLAHLLLTKRPENIIPFWPMDVDDRQFSARFKRFENVWLGTSIEDQETADKRILFLLECRDLSPVLWLSIEPLLDDIDFSGGDWFCPECKFYLSSSRVTNDEKCDSCGSEVEFHNMLHGIDWAIIGCESAPGKKVGRLSLKTDMMPASDWIESAARIVEQCRNAGVAVFVKQIPVNGKIETDPANFPPELQYQEFPTSRTAVPKT